MTRRQEDFLNKIFTGVLFLDNRITEINVNSTKKPYKSKKKDMHYLL